MAEKFPPGCPPSDAAAKPGTYFRLTHKGEPVGAIATEKAWLRPYETPLSSLEGQVSNVDAHGLSVYADILDLERGMELNPRYAKKPVAQVEISSSDGVLRHSPSASGESHHDWWTDPFDLYPQARIVQILGA